MKILLLGLEEDINFVRKTIKDISVIKQTILWTDYSGPQELANIKQSEYDYIILSVKNEQIKNQMYSLLIYAYNIKQNKILDFYGFYKSSVPLMVADRRMKYPLIEKYKGLIFGISHSEVGIIARMLKEPFCNLAVSSQDIFYNLKTLEYCYNKYRAKIENVEQIVFEMFDYHYFNFDTSMSKNADTYYTWGGVIIDSHNFTKNKKAYPFSFEQYIEHLLASRYSKLSQQKIDVLNDLFGDLHKHTQYSAFYDFIDIEKRVNTLKGNEPDVTSGTSTLNKVFHDTLKQNIMYFYQFLDLVYKINPNMKVTLLLMPRYHEAQESTKALYAPWKECFYTIINDANKKYPFQFFDLKDCEISKDKLCFQDISHLNYYGAVRFTNFLIPYLYK